MSKLITKQKVAEMLGIHPHSVMRLVAEKKFPAPLKLSDAPQAAVRFDAEDVSAWIEQRKASVTASACA